MDLLTMLSKEELRPLLRDAIAFGVLCSDRAWNGVTMGQDQAETDRRLDAMVQQYIEQT